ncbi:hypothetical protein GCM10007916_37460 [Psychromonas marina]|uniref:Uncharacterized protein n=1 Tax=Psychromonas marina TaxID=88364 RepID=A0ABQ6E5I6_9GAMM|nr:hypothetical protein GCM10007916_37460 [Psychromonas marina]
MTYNKIIVSEAMKSTFLTTALFTLFDITIQGYSDYHNWIISFYVGAFSLYYLIAKRYF